MKIYILAVTKAYDKFCIAGMTEDNQWIRPIPKDSPTRFWTQAQITAQGYGVVRPGDILELDGYHPEEFEHPNHIEDFIVEGRMKLVKRLSNDEFIDFLEDKVESLTDFNNTVHANGRSLCLIKVDDVDFDITQFNETEPKKPKATPSSIHFDATNPLTHSGNYIVKDCKWSRLILNHFSDFESAYPHIYFVIGLATKHRDVEYPQLIGLHTYPEVQYPETYPH